MTRFGWLAVAALAGLLAGCGNDDALYTSPKYVPGYTPSGAVAAVHDEAPKPDWRMR